jgi:probable phosphoglycerate mutase
LTHFLLVRHGSTDALGRTLCGWTPGVSLNDAGRSEVRALCERLGGLEVAAVYGSPLERTQQTAALLAARFGLEPKLREEAGEIRFGDWTGRDFTALDRDPGFQRWNRLRSAMRAPGGETIVEAQARIVALMLRLRELHPDELVIAVSHGDVIRAALAYWLGIPVDLFRRLEIAPASVSAVVLDEHAIRVPCVNDTGARPLREVLGR